MTKEKKEKQPKKEAKPPKATKSTKDVPCEKCKKIFTKIGLGRHKCQTSKPTEAVVATAEL